MAANLLTAEDLDGIYEKLKRADESIGNLNTEITAFLKPAKATFSQNRQKAANELLQHVSRKVPLRFGMLAGEIAHQLRSCLDHIAWLLSSTEYREGKSANAIAFPICLSEPLEEDEIRSYRRKVKGILSSNALALIKALQPYSASNPVDDPLAIVHELNRIDKHRTLVLVVGRWDVTAQIPLGRSWMIGGFQINQESFAATEADKLKVQFTQLIVFDQFGERKRQPVIPSLTQLANAIRDVVRQFSELKV